VNTSSRRLLRRETASAEPAAAPYWSAPIDEVERRLQSGPNGLAAPEAADRLNRYGPNVLEASSSRTWFDVLSNQLRSPLLLLLVFAAIASGLTQEWFDAGMVLVIVVTTVVTGFAREYSAETAAQALRARVRIRTRALRDSRLEDVDLTTVVPGDVIELAAGSLVPGDGILLEATDFFVSEAALTGESFPVEKRPGPVAASAPLAQRTNCVFFGTNVRSGTARCLVVQTGPRTEFGAIARSLARRAPEAEFDRGLRHFGYLLTVAMLVLVVVVFATHMLRGRPAVETLLFSIALAVGLSPELLPAILSINLSRGARLLARQGVLVRRLNAIENLGSMDVLCTDKTGTLTEGVVRVQDAFDTSGVRAPEILELAACNAALETGVGNPLDDALLAAHRTDLSGLDKRGEIPFDFARRRVSVVVTTPERHALMVTKGAFLHVLEACTSYADGRPLDHAARASLAERYESWSRDGIRVLAVATREIVAQQAYTRDDERDMTFRGFVTFLDHPKEGVADALTALARLGVSFKLVTGDNALVARHVATLVGLRCDRVVTGRELNSLHDGALWHAVEQADVFAEVDPGQKERIILALKRTGHVVGFLGDGVNDAPAMHAADTSLSVETAVDVAREAADFVLLEHGLDVIRRGVEEGRRTFANTMKYVLITTSANLGNMVSMAAASIVLPFLPLLAGQILLNNLLSDIPAVGLADDGVDRELVARPERWDITFIGRFMIVFGLVSSLFDVITFVVLRFVFHAGPELFRSTWFVESLLTELVVALVVRTRRPFFRSRPGTTLMATTAGVAGAAVALPYLPGVSLLGFVPLPWPVLGSVVVIAAAYVVATEVVKARFYQSTSFRKTARATIAAAT
jgi:Mg2+-importing ATPase